MRNKIDLNTASREELMEVDGMTPVAAEAILRYRKEQGFFESVEELRDLPGVNPIVLDQMYETFEAIVTVPASGEEESPFGATAYTPGAFGSGDNPGADRDADSNQATNTGEFPDTERSKYTEKSTSPREKQPARR